MDSSKGYPIENRSAMESTNDSPTELQSAAAVAAAVDAEETISDSFICCVCLDLLYKPIVLPCGHISCFWCVHISMSGQSDSHCPVCRFSYGHFPTVCQMLHSLLIKMYPIAYRRREKQILEEEKAMETFSPQLDGLGWESRDCLTGEDKDKVSSADLLCLTCKQLLFHPVVLNCGHVYCEACIINPAAENLRCQVCGSLNPKGIPKVCLVLDHFLEEKFPKEYESRREALQLKQLPSKSESSSASAAEAGNQESSSSPVPSGNLPSTFDPHSKIHLGVGCDYCGMYPIIGDRYKCKDCTEKIGFDLCGDCYKSQAKLSGRFNQQHTAEHKLDLKKPRTLRYLEVWPIPRNVDQENDTFVIPEGASVTIEDGVLIATLPDNSEGNTSNDAGAPVTSPGGNVEYPDAPFTSPGDNVLDRDVPVTSSGDDVEDQNEDDIL